MPISPLATLDKRQAELLTVKRNAYTIALGLVSLMVLAWFIGLSLGIINFPSAQAYYLVNISVLLIALGAIWAMRRLENVRRVEWLLLWASVLYLLYWDIVALATYYQPSTEFLMTSAAHLLLCGAFFCLVLSPRWLLAGLFGWVTLHELLTWVNLLRYGWSTSHTAQLTTDLYCLIVLLFLTLIARYQGMLAASHQENELLELLAHTDPLTGLANRRFMYQQLHQTPTAAILLMDLDGFKAINDQFGHDVGDEVLVSVGQTLRQVAGPNAGVARWGGEEFLVMLPDTDPTAAAHTAEAIRAAVAQLDGLPVRVSISIGLAFAHATRPLQESLNRADQLMYQAKQSGKNRVVREKMGE